MLDKSTLVAAVSKKSHRTPVQFTRLSYDCREKDSLGVSQFVRLNSEDPESFRLPERQNLHSNDELWRSS